MCMANFTQEPVLGGIPRYLAGEGVCSRFYIGAQELLSHISIKGKSYVIVIHKRLKYTHMHNQYIDTSAGTYCMLLKVLTTHLVK